MLKKIIAWIKSERDALDAVCDAHTRKIERVIKHEDKRLNAACEKLQALAERKRMAVEAHEAAIARLNMAHDVAKGKILAKRARAIMESNKRLNKLRRANTVLDRIRAVYEYK